VNPVLVEKQCETCSKLFSTSRTDKRFCCARCLFLSPNRAAKTSAYRAKRLPLLDKIKLERGCEHCGYREDARALQFDHIDPATKSFTIGSSSHLAWERVVAEIAKCRVLCANCHMIKTHEDRQ